VRIIFLLLVFMWCQFTGIGPTIMNDFQYGETTG